MTEANQPSDGVKLTKGKFDFVNDPRQWSAAATKSACFRLARRKGKRLVEIIETETSGLPIVCIFEDYPDE